MNFTGYNGDTIPLQRYSRIKALKLELHYVRMSRKLAHPKVSSSENKRVADQNNQKENDIVQILSLLKGQMTARELSDLSGLRLARVRDCMAVATSRNITSREKTRIGNCQMWLYKHAG